MSGYQTNSIFWVETGKINPNPFQPRREFEPGALEDLADSIRQYGVLQPLVVTRKETVLPDNRGMDVHYELIAGERRLRASIMAGLQQVPVIIRKESDDKVKLELAIIENLQREDLNPIDRALAFEQLHKEFGLTHVEIGKRMGKSRVYVSNSLRLLSMPEEIKQGLIDRRISEGHTRPLMMLADRPEEQATLYKEIMVKKMSVRDAEKVARKIAQDRVRKKEFIVDPKIQAYEKRLAENLGTRVHIEPKEQGGQITIDYFTIDDLESILSSMKKSQTPASSAQMMDNFLASQNDEKQEEVIHDSVPIRFETKESEQEEEEQVHNTLPGEMPEDDEPLADTESFEEFKNDMGVDDVSVEEPLQNLEKQSEFFTAGAAPTAPTAEVAEMAEVAPTPVSDPEPFDKTIKELQDEVSEVMKDFDSPTEETMPVADTLEIDESISVPEAPTSDPAPLQSEPDQGEVAVPQAVPQQQMVPPGTDPYREPITEEDTKSLFPDDDPSGFMNKFFSNKNPQ